MPAEAVSSLSGSSVFSRLRNLYVLSKDPGSDLSPLSACAELDLLSLSPAETGDRLPIPAGGDLLASMSRLSTLRCAFAEVSNWLGTTPLPPRLKRLELDRCALPENASALLDLPGVEVTIT